MISQISFNFRFILVMIRQIVSEQRIQRIRCSKYMGITGTEMTESTEENPHVFFSYSD